MLLDRKIIILVFSMLIGLLLSNYFLFCHSKQNISYNIDYINKINSEYHNLQNKQEQNAKKLNRLQKQQKQLQQSINNIYQDFQAKIANTLSQSNQSGVTSKAKLPSKSSLKKLLFHCEQLSQANNIPSTNNNVHDKSDET